MATIGTLTAFINADNSNFKRGFQEASTVANGFNKIIGGIAIAAVTKKMFDMGIQSVRLASDMQQTTVALETMTGSLDTSLKIINDAREKASKTPFEFTDIIQIEKRLIAFGFEIQKIPSMIDAIGNAAAGLGMGAEGINRISMAIGQIQAKGRLQGEELLQLAEAGIPAYEMLAEKIGKTIPEALKMVERGAIDSTTAIEAIIEGANKRFSGLMEQQSQTIGGAWSNLGDSTTNLLTALGQQIDMVFDISGILRWGSTVVDQMANVETIFKQTLKEIELEKLNQQISDVKKRIAYLPTNILVDNKIKPILMKGLKEQLLELEKELKKLSENPPVAFKINLAADPMHLNSGKIDPRVKAVQDELEASLAENARMSALLGKTFNKTTEDANALYDAIQKMIILDPQNSSLKKWAEQYQALLKSVGPEKNIGGAIDNATKAEVAVRMKIGGAIEEATRAEIAVRMRMAGAVPQIVEQAAPKVYKFNDYLDQASSLLSGVDGPLREFAAGLIGAIEKIQTVAKNISALSPESIQANSQGPLGAFGGMLGMLGAISGIMGVLGGVLSQLLGLDKVAEQQQKAAEAWMRFLKEASVSQMFGKREELEAKLTEYRKQLAEAQKIGGVAGIALRELWGKKIEEILKQLEQIPEAAQQLLGVTIQDLSSAISSAFSAADLSEFNAKFKENFTEMMRQAMINAWVSEQALKPLQDAIMKAFDPSSSGGISITSKELENLKALWAAIGKKGADFYEILDELGLGMEDLSKATSSVTNALINLPEGLKVARYEYRAMEAKILDNTAANSAAASLVSNLSSMASMASLSGAPVQSAVSGLTSSGELAFSRSSAGIGDSGGSTGQTPIKIDQRIYLDGRDITDRVKFYTTQDSLNISGSSTPGAPIYVGG